jgi:hypothetical protein
VSIIFRTLAIVPALACIAACADDRGGILSFVTFHPNRGANIVGSAGRIPEIEIDSTLAVKWDIEAFHTYLLNAQDTKSLTIFIPKLQGIKDAMAVFAEGQQRRLAEALAEINTAFGDDEETKGASVLEYLSAKQHANDYVKEAEAKLLQNSQLEPGFYRDLIAANSQAKGGDLSAMAQSIKDRAEDLKTELDSGLSKLGEYKVSMSALLISRTGGASPIHLKDYDKVVEGEERSFPRRQFVLDKRTREALAAAQELANFARQLGSGTLMDQVRSSFSSVRERTGSLFKRLQLEVFEARLADLVKKLQEVGTSNVAEILGEVRQIQYLVAPLSRSVILKQKTESAGLLKLADAIDGFSKSISKNILELPNRLASLDNRLKDLLVAQPGILESSVVDFFIGFRKSMVQETTALNKLVNGFARVAQVLSVSGDVTETVAELVPREVGASESLDTELNLKKIEGERHPGDKVVVQIKLLHADPGSTEDELIEETKQTFRVEAYGGYIEPSGALVFVDPRSAISRHISFEPTLALSFNYKYGMRGSSFWNHVLNPGVGVGFSLLDFDDNKKFELGISANITLFNDLLNLGYGRNIQAKADYFYIGFNPLAVRGLFRR